MSDSRGAVIWLTGLPGAGKATIARAVHAVLVARGVPTELLEGAEVRESLSRGLGFSPEDRDEHVRRIGFVAKLLSRNGVVAICAAVSPQRAARDEVRQHVTNFIEVFVDGSTPAADPGMAYEPPTAPEVHVRPAAQSVPDAIDAVLAALEQRGILAAWRDARREAQEAEIRRRLAALGYR